MAGMERFTQRARRVLSLAHQEAERDHNNSIGPEHLLIDLMLEEGGVGARVLRELGVTSDRVREEIGPLTNAPATFDPNRVELGVQTQQVLENAVDEARQLGHHYIGTEHVLLGLVQVNSIAIQVLHRLGVNEDQIRRQTRRVLNESAAFRQTQNPQAFSSAKTNQVLLIHGRDTEATQAVANYIEGLGLDVVRSDQILGRQIDIFVTEVDFAVALLTADDLMESKSQSRNAKFHASQNVIYELGFFRGKLGYKRVCALFKSDPEMSVELPTESFRLAYVPLDSAGEWKLRLSKQMQEAGIVIDSGDIQ